MPQSTIRTDLILSGYWLSVFRAVEHGCFTGLAICGVYFPQSLPTVRTKKVFFYFF
jgi:hypothetical protein